MAKATKKKQSSNQPQLGDNLQELAVNDELTLKLMQLINYRPTTGGMSRGTILQFKEVNESSWWMLVKDVNGGEDWISINVQTEYLTANDITKVK